MKDSPVSQAANVDVGAYFGLVIYHAKKVYSRIAGSCSSLVELSELIQEGMVALTLALSTYDQSRKTSFAAYATPRIRGAMLDHLRHLDPLNQRDREKVKSLEQANDYLTQRFQRAPHRHEIAQFLSISEDEVCRRQGLRICVVPIEEMCGMDSEFDETEAGGFTIDHHNPEEYALAHFDETERNRLGSDIDECLQTALDAMERSVLIHRVLDELPLKEVGRIWSTSKDTIWRREKEAKVKMKRCLGTKGWEVTGVMELLACV